MSKPKDPCRVCPFIRDCVAEGEDRRWCFVRILTLEAWDRVAQRRKRKVDYDGSLRSAFGLGRDDRDGGGAE